MEDIKILENNFNAVYQEYKEYQTFLKNSAEEIKKQRENLAKISNDNEEEIIEKAFEVLTKPHYYAEDLLKLQVRLKSIYDFSKDVLEIPSEIKEEIDKFLVNRQIYRIEKGAPKEIDTEYTKKLTEEAKKHYKEQLKNLKTKPV